MAAAESRSERIEVRTTPGVKALLQQAAALSNKNVTEFLPYAGLNAARISWAVGGCSCWTMVRGELSRKSLMTGHRASMPPNAFWMIGGCSSRIKRK